jgi:hypothetical protein
MDAVSTRTPADIAESIQQSCMTYELTLPQLPPFPAEVLAKFRRGDDRERDLLADLTRIGRDAEPGIQGRRSAGTIQAQGSQGRIAISGKVDARLEIDGARPPIEVEGLVADDGRPDRKVRGRLRQPWTRSGGYQLLSYLYGAGEPYGFLLLDRSGIPGLLPVELEPNLDRVEDFLTRAEQAIDHVEAGTLPDFLDDDPAECRRCAWYGHTCNPPLTANAATLLTDPELEAALERREQLKAAADEYAGLDKDIKAKLRGVEMGIAGKFQIVGRWQKQSRVELPPN